MNRRLNLDACLKSTLKNNGSRRAFAPLGVSELGYRRPQDCGVASSERSANLQANG
jgi:hypothetical protein